MLGVALAACLGAGASRERPTQQPDTSQKDKSVTEAVLPRGKKLILKDGTYQVVREYQRNGERVRYYSMERGSWEEVPSSMVDWEATAKAESDSEKASAAQVEKIHKHEEAHRMDNVADIDASLQVGKGAFLPDAEGMYIVEGKTVRALDQVGSQLKGDKLRTLAQIISPVPLVPGKKSIVLPGNHAALRIKTPSPEFYLREPPPDPERVSTIQKSRRAGDAGPGCGVNPCESDEEWEALESINVMLGQEISSKVTRFRYRDGKWHLRCIGSR